MWWIKQSIKRALADQGKTIRLLVQLVDEIAKVGRVALQIKLPVLPHRPRVIPRLDDSHPVLTTQFISARHRGKEFATVRTKYAYHETEIIREHELNQGCLLRRARHTRRS